MNPQTLDLLCNPYKGEPFVQDGEYLVGAASGQRFPIQAGIPVILEDRGLPFKTQWMRRFYDLGAGLYDPVVELGSRIGLGSETRIRETVIAAIDLPAGARLLETSIGTASNAYYLPEEIDYFGQDLSIGMLRVARRKTAALKRGVELFQCEGARLPFRDGAFDFVLNMGGLQFYADAFRGVKEMARVLKPGGRALVVDQALPAARMLRRMPAHKAYARTVEQAVENMVRLVPFTMANYHSELLPGGEFYQLVFQKPALPAS